MIVCGVGLFLYKDKPTNNDNNNNTKLFNILGIGELLVVSCCLFIYLFICCLLVYLVVIGWCHRLSPRKVKSIS